MVAESFIMGEERLSNDAESVRADSEKLSMDTDIIQLETEDSSIDSSKLRWMLPGRSGRNGAGRSELLCLWLRWMACSASMVLLGFVLRGLFGQRGKLLDMIHGDPLHTQSPIHNHTLGFQKVFAIGLPGRTDRRDALTIATSLSSIDVDWSDGVDFEKMRTKAIPKAFTDANISPSVIASWRAHLNVLSRIVQENIQTALILEDDTDWDWNIKSQLEQFATGLVELQQGQSGDEGRNSPYGDTWDTLWVGNCRIRPSNESQDFYFITNDSTVPPLPFRRSLFKTPYVLPEVFENNTRIVLRADMGGCTFGYAMTWEAALKVLTSLSLGGDGLIFDVALANMCNGTHITPYNCYGIYPPLISSHRFAGSANRDSDIKNISDHYHGEYTWDVVYSVLQNAPDLLAGATNVQSQWPEDTIPSRPLDQKYTDEVSGEIRTVEVRMLAEQHLPGINEPHPKGTIYWRPDDDG